MADKTKVQPKSNKSELTIEELQDAMIRTVRTMTPKEKAELRRVIREKLLRKK
jgi:hypothetical protein